MVLLLLLLSLLLLLLLLLYALHPHRLSFRSYASAARNCPMLVSLNTYVWLAQQGGNRSIDKPLENFGAFANSARAPTGNDPANCYRSDCMIERVFVQIKAGASKQEKQVVINAIRSNLDSDLQFVFDTLQSQADANMANDFLQVFLNVIAAIAFALCFFVTSVTVVANIRESVREIGGEVWMGSCSTLLYSALI